jgi:hypothetical protein
MSTAVPMQFPSPEERELQRTGDVIDVGVSVEDTPFELERSAISYMVEVGEAVRCLAAVARHGRRA